MRPRVVSLPAIGRPSCPVAHTASRIMHTSPIAPRSSLALSVACVLALSACAPSGSETVSPAASSPAETAAALPQTPSAPASGQPGIQSAGIDPLVPLDEAQRDDVLTPAFSCNLDALDGAVFSGTDLTVDDPGDIVATGWLVPEGGTTAESVALRVESADKSQVWQVPVSLDLARHDLPNAAGTNGAGFSKNFDASALPSGRYHLYLAYTMSDRLMGCDNGRFVVFP